MNYRPKHNPLPVATIIFSALLGTGNVFAESPCRQSAIFGKSKWIGAPSDRLPFLPARLTVFTIGFDLRISRGSIGSFIYGADDPRLMNRNQNIYNLENRKGTSYIETRFSSDGTIAIYRVGYSPKDERDTPVTTFKTDKLITDGSANRIEIRSNLGHTDIFVNGEKAGYCGINPIGNGGDYIAFPALCDFGARIPDGSNATISDITIRNFRSPANILFSQTGTASGKELITVNERSMPELRSEFTVDPSKEVRKAETIVTAREIGRAHV